MSPSQAVYVVVFRSMVMLCNCLGAFTYCALQQRYPVGTVSKAAPIVALLAVVPDVAPWLDGALGGHEQGEASMWAVCGLGFALGFTHFLCSPAAEGGRLKAVTMAATGHMHGATKLLYKVCTGGVLKAEECEKMAQSCNITCCMLLGAVLGATALHVNPLGKDDDWLLLPVGVTLFCALTVHDAAIEPPGGWPVKSDLHEPLAKAAVPVAPAPV
jgi:hypothetical protein